MVKQEREKRDDQLYNLMHAFLCMCLYVCKSWTSFCFNLQFLLQPTISTLLHIRLAMRFFRKSFKLKIFLITMSHFCLIKICDSLEQPFFFVPCQTCRRCNQASKLKTHIFLQEVVNRGLNMHLSKDVFFFVLVFDHQIWGCSMRVPVEKKQFQ